MKFSLRSSLRGLILILVSCCIATAFILLLGARHSSDSDGERKIDLGDAKQGDLYSVTVAIKDPSRFTTAKSIAVSIADSAGVVSEKRLHAQDLDFYVTIRPRANGPVSATLRAPSDEEFPQITAKMLRIPQNGSEPAVISAMPNDTWQTAQPFEFGQTIFGSADERPYAPAPDEDRYAALVKGFQWFKFTFHGSQPNWSISCSTLPTAKCPSTLISLHSAKTMAAGKM